MIFLTGEAMMNRSLIANTESNGSRHVRSAYNSSGITIEFGRTCSTAQLCCQQLSEMPMRKRESGMTEKEENDGRRGQEIMSL
jgi:hypothetical protein